MSTYMFFQQHPAAILLLQSAYFNQVSALETKHILLKGTFTVTTIPTKYAQANKRVCSGHFFHGYLQVTAEPFCLLRVCLSKTNPPKKYSVLAIVHLRRSRI